MTKPATNTTMCILASSLDWHGDSSAPVAVYDGGDPLCGMLGKSEGCVIRGRFVFGGVTMTAHRLPGSAYMLLNAEVETA